MTEANADLPLGGLRVIDGHLTMGMLMAFQSLTLAFLTPINRLVALGGQLQELQDHFLSFAAQRS